MKGLKRIWLGTALACCLNMTAQDGLTATENITLAGMTVPAVIESNGDTIPYVALRPYYLYGPIRFTSRSEYRAYQKLVRDVKLCLPLAKIVANTIIETTEYLETLPDDKARDKHLRQLEKDLIKDYEPLLRRMTYSQGKVLLKLIVRECDSSPYEIIKAYMGGFVAGFWQGVAKLFTADLKTDYNPLTKDVLIERIAIQVEQGQL